MQKHIFTIVGARPQFIKASALSHAIQNHSGFRETLLHTGQHFDENMSEVFFEELNLPKPKYTLNIHSLPHGAMTGRMLEQIEKILIKETPDIVVLYGDTNSTLAGALAASKLGIPIAHVEAGLRSANWEMPEEQNRVLTDRLSRYLFVPSAKAEENLHKEGIHPKFAKIVNVGDIMYDVFLKHNPSEEEVNAWLHQHGLKRGKFALASIHRQENVANANKLSEIIDALNTIEEEVHILLPAHPRTVMAIEKHKLKHTFTVCAPLSYKQMLHALVSCSFVLTDSGGLQKEAFYAKKMCYTLRSETEWKELVDLKVNHVIPNFSQLPSIIKNAVFEENSFMFNPYGDGSSASKILEALM